MSEQFAEHESEDILAAAWRVTDGVKNAEGYDELASAIALRYAGRRDFDRAIEIADTINDPYARDKTLADISVKCAAAGDEEGAFALLDSLEDFSFQTEGASQIALAHAASGNFDRAIEVASEMEDNSSTLAEIAAQCAAKGEFGRARQIAEGLDFPLYKTLALTRIADGYLQAGRAAEAVELLSHAHDETLSIDDDTDRPNMLAEIALKLSEAGETEQAARVLAKAAEEAEISDNKDALLAQIAASYARMKQYDRAVEMVENIDDVYLTAATLSNLATIERTEEGRESEAVQLLADARDLLIEDEPEEYKDVMQRNNMLAHLASQYAAFGQFDEALKIAQGIDAPDDKTQALIGIVSHAAEAGQYDIALRAARLIEEQNNRADALLRISRKMLAANEREQGIKVLTENVSMMENLEPPQERVRARMGAAIQYVEAERKEQSASLIRQALTETQAIGGYFQKASALLAINDASEKTGYALDEASKELLWEISAA